jgi:hypothetical protein
VGLAEVAAVVGGLAGRAQHGRGERVAVERRVVGQLLRPAPDLDEIAVGDRVEQPGDHRRGLVDSTAATR